jgi:hypothetical protein
MKTTFKPLCTALLTLLAGVAHASGPGEKHHEGTSYLPNGTLTYAVFETSIDHVDLADCPAQFDPDAVFCRMTLASEMAHVFAFSHDGDQPLLAVKSYELDSDFLPF